MLFVLKTTYLIMHACANIHQEAWRVLARLADICQPVLLGLARLANIRQEAWQVLARLADIHQPVLLGLAILAHIPQRLFLEK
jgi:hypothetical protein